MDTPAPPVKFDKSFTEQIEKYIEIYKKQGKKPTVSGFANRINTDEKSIWAWATKKKKDEQGNVTEELARPNFHAAVTKLHTIESTPDEEKLNERQELFCQYYATDREFFGNGVQTYIEVYEPDRHKKNWYKQACSSASEILSNPKVFNRINQLLEDGGLNDVNVDKQLQFLINQQSDFTNKIAAIREYNKLKSRIIERMDHTTKGKELPTPIYGSRAVKTV